MIRNLLALAALAVATRRATVSTKVPSPQMDGLLIDPRRGHIDVVLTSVGISWREWPMRDRRRHLAKFRETGWRISDQQAKDMLIGGPVYLQDRLFTRPVEPQFEDASRYRAEARASYRQPPNPLFTASVF